MRGRSSGEPEEAGQGEEVPGVAGVKAIWGPGHGQDGGIPGESPEGYIPGIASGRYAGESGLMEWEIHAASRKSSVTGERFAPGEVFVSLLVLEDRGGIGRYDIREAEREAFAATGTVIGRWVRRMPEAGESLAEEEARSALDIGELFFSLAEAAEEETAEATTARIHLRHLVALMLERRRVLKPIGSRVRLGRQGYRYVGREEPVDVEVPELDPEVLRSLGDPLDLLLT